MSQLPFLGKKTKPAAIRTDLWRPYCRVEFSGGKEWLGLLAYRKLREYNMLRYYSWNREGANLPRNRQERTEDLMDQRATSVADLAKVLEESETWTSQEEKLAAAQRRQVDTRLNSLWERVQKVSELVKKEDIFPKLEAAINSRLERLRDAEVTMEEKEQLKRDILQKRTRRNFLANAATAIDAVNGAFISPEKWQALTKEFKELIKLREGKATKPSRRQEGVTSSELNVPGVAKDATSAVPRSATTIISSSGSHDQTLSTQRLSSSTSSGGDQDLPSAPGPIRVSWDDLRDAQWATSWPASVLHEPLGYLVTNGSLRVFPSLKAQPITDMTPEEEQIMDQTRLDGEASEEGSEQGREEAETEKDTAEPADDTRDVNDQSSQKDARNWQTTRTMADDLRQSRNGQRIGGREYYRQFMTPEAVIAERQDHFARPS